MEKVYDQNIYYIPGRLRLKVSALYRNPWAALRLENLLSRIDGILVVNANPVTGKALIIFDPEELGIEELSAAILRSDFTSSLVLREKFLSSPNHSLEESPLKVQIKKIADQYSEKIVPFSFLLAAAVFFLTRDFSRSMTILIVASPCATRMAVPTALSAAVGNAARRGILIKGGSYLEQAGKIDTIFFDKTGTLTSGKPVVTSISSLYPGMTAREILALAAGCEGANRHPLEWAVLNRAQGEKLNIPRLENVQGIVGYGVKGWLEGKEVLLGSQSLMEQYQVDLTNAQGKIRRMKHLGETILFLAKGRKLIGLLGVKDTIREESKEAVVRLREEGIQQIGLLTGDHWETAHLIGEELGLSQVYSQALPEDKLAIIQEEQEKGRIVAMVGDGINNSTALAAADLGIVMGTGGTDVAIEAADIVLAGDDPRKIVSVVRLSKQTMDVIYQSFTWSIAINALGIALGAIGIINPLTGAILHNASNLTVVINSARILYFQPDQSPS